MKAEPEATTVPRAFKPGTIGQRWDMSRQRVYAIIKRGELRAVKIDGSLRVLESDLLEYLARCGR